MLDANPLSVWRSNKEPTMLSHAQAQAVFESVVQRVYREDCDAMVAKAIGDGLNYVKNSTDLKEQIYRCPLGFLDVPLKDMFELPYEPHVHIWHGRNRGAANSVIHYHNMDITSLVATGALKDRIYDTVDSPPNTHAFYRVETGDFGSRSVREARYCTPHLRQERTITSGQVYRLPALTCHYTAIEEDNWPVTFMLISNRHEVPHGALGDINGPQIEQFEHVNDLDDAEFDSVLTESIARLAAVKIGARAAAAG